MRTVHVHIHDAPVNREKSGRYVYSGSYERECTCGHKFNQHYEGHPQACQVSGCSCQQFRPTKEKRT